MPSSTVSDLPPALEALAEGLVTSFASGDMLAWLSAFADDGVLWHSYDDRVKPATEVAGMLGNLCLEVLREQGYHDVRRFHVSDGYVQQHTLRMTARSGEEFQTGVCLVVSVADGRVRRMDEYLDSSVFGFVASASSTPVG